MTNPADIALYKARVNSETDSNGGRRSTTRILIDRPRGNIFPPLERNQLTTGITRYRKVFAKLNSITDDPIDRVEAFIYQITPAPDYVMLFQGTAVDTALDFPPSPTFFGAGILQADASPGDTTITVQVEQVDSPIFRIGDNILVSRRILTDEDTDPQEFKTITDVSLSGQIYTITLDSPINESFLSAYPDVPDLPNYTIVSSLLTIENVENQVLNLDINSAQGAFDTSQLSIVNAGAVFDTWTFLFDGPNTFTVSGADTGDLGLTGNTSSEFSPINPDSVYPYFTVPATAFSGSFAAGDTIQFTTQPVEVPIWFVQTVPDNTAPESYNQNNGFGFAYFFEGP